MNKNISEATNALNSEKSIDAASGIVSDLMKFSMTSSENQTANKHMADTIISVAEEQLPVPIIIGGPKEPRSSTKEQHCQEVTSQELPMFLNSPAQSIVPNEKISSEHLPVFLNNPVQPTTSNEEVSSEYLPVFLNNSAQSDVLFNKEVLSSDIPLCLNR